VTPSARAAPATIVTPRLSGRLPRASDIEYARAIGADWQIQKTLFERLWSESECVERLERWTNAWQERGFGFWIFEDAAKAIVGHGGLFPSTQTPSDIELGYIVRTPFWGNGIATEIVQAAVAVAFDDMQLPALVANCMPENAASRRVLEKCGFHFVRETLYDGRYPNVEYRRSAAGESG